MKASYSVSHLSDGALLQGLNSLVTEDRATTAAMLAHLAEVDERKLYARAGYSSLFAYCLRELHFSEDITSKRIRAARAARKFPALLHALEDGRLHLSGIVLLAPKLTAENAGNLIAAATHKTLDEIEKLLACDFPKPDIESRIRKLPGPRPEVPSEHAARHVSASGEPAALELGAAETLAVQEAARPEQSEPAAQRTESAAVERRGRLTPLAASRFAIQATIGDEGHDFIRRAQELLSHQIPSGDLSQVIEFVFKDFVERRENQKFGTTKRPRKASGKTKASKNKRHISRPVRRAVRKRDGNQCTYVSPEGKRCDCRKFLEFHHVIDFSLGGESTVPNLQLMCRTHNQLLAEQKFGAGFMRLKREAARLEVIKRRGAAGRAQLGTNGPSGKAALAARKTGESGARQNGAAVP